MKGMGHLDWVIFHWRPTSIKMLASMQLYLVKGNVWWFSRLKRTWEYLCLPDVVHKRRKINSDLFCFQKTGQVYVRVHVTYQRKTIITTVVHIVGEKILNDINWRLSWSYLKVDFHSRTVLPILNRNLLRWR